MKTADLNDRLRAGTLPEDLLDGEPFDAPPGDPGNGTGCEGFGTFGTASGPSQDDEWPDPIALEVRPEPFPSDLLPDGLREWVAAQTEALQVPHGMMAALAIGAIGGAIGGKVKLDLGRDWTEKQAGLYIAVIAKPGERKSAAIARAIGPVLDAERDESEAQRPEVARSMAKVGTLKKRLAGLQSAAGNPKAKPAERDRFQREIEGVAEELDAAVRDAPSLPRLGVNDATPEALLSLLGGQHERLFVASAEGGEVFSLSGGRHGDHAAPEALLRGWSCDPVRVDRKTSEPVTLHEPALQLVLCVQPDVVRGVGDLRELKTLGLLERFFFAAPRSMVGLQRVDVETVPEDLATLYRRALSTMAQWRIDKAERLLFKLDAEAQERLDGFRRELGPNLGAGGDLSDLPAWGSKAPGNLARVAALYTAWSLACAGYLGCEDLAPCNRIVAGDDMRRALAIFPYWLSHARRAFGLLGADQATGDAVYLLARLRRRGEPRISSATSLLVEPCASASSVPVWPPNSHAKRPRRRPRGLRLAMR